MINYEEQITRLESTRITGFFGMDSGLWWQCDDIILSEAPLEVKARALAIIDRIIGESNGLGADGVAAYEEHIRHNRGLPPKLR